MRGPRYFQRWLGHLVFSVGDTLHSIALVELVYQLTGQGAAIPVLVGR